jgi:competence protein ComGC
MYALSTIIIISVFLLLLLSNMRTDRKNLPRKKTAKRRVTGK